MSRIRAYRPGYSLAQEFYVDPLQFETELELTWLVHEHAVAGRDYDPDAVCWLWKVTAAQDRTICENNQLGILSSRYQPGPDTAAESSVSDFEAWWLLNNTVLPRGAPDQKGRVSE